MTVGERIEAGGNQQRMLRSAPFWYRNFPRLTHMVRRICRANYEREMELLDVLCDRARVGIDVGAKVGMYTYRIRDRSAKVIAFEPIPTFNQMLAKVFDGKCGQIEPYALSNRRGRTMLRMPYESGDRGQWGRSTIEPANQLAQALIRRTDEIEIETRMLDEYELTGVGFIKIDVEGHEGAVLEGAERTIEVNRPNMLIECNDEHCPNARNKLAAWLRRHGYVAYFAFDGDLRGIEQHDFDLHWHRHGIENFVCIHRSRAAVLEAVRERARTIAPPLPALPHTPEAADRA